VKQKEEELMRRAEAEKKKNAEEGRSAGDYVVYRD